MAFVSAFAFVCQNILTEKDDVSTAVRIVEVFFVPKEALDEANKFPAVGMSLYVHVRFSHDDEDEHEVAFILTRPSGDAKRQVLVSKWRGINPKFPGTDKTINAAGVIGVEPRELGRHEYSIECDGKIVARAYFTLMEQQTPLGNPSQTVAETPPLKN